MNRWLILLIVTGSALGMLAITLGLVAQVTASPPESTTAVTSTDFYAWGIVVGDGFGYPYNQRLNTFGEFKGQLYAGTLNGYDGAQIWRSTDGVHWTLASTVSGHI